MNVTILKDEGLNFHVKVIIPSEKIKNGIQSELAKLAPQVKIAGFRIGKVPLSIISKKYSAAVKGDLIKEEIKHSINHIIKNYKLTLATDPQLEGLKSDDEIGLSFDLKFERMPAILMPDFKKITLERPVLDVEKKEIDEGIAELAQISKQYPKESKGKAAKGDQVTIDAVGYVEEKAFEGGKLDQYKLVLGSGAFIAGFEDQLIGTKSGEEISVKVTFPENYHVANLAGKPAEFKVKVIAVHKPETAKIDDNFAKKFNCENIEKLREQIKQNLENFYSKAINTLMKMYLFNKLEDLLNFEVPPSLLDKEYQILQSQTAEEKESQPLPENASAGEKETEEESAKYLQKLALRRVRIGLMLAEYVKNKNLGVEQNDLKNAVMDIVRTVPGREKEVFDYYKNNPNALENLKGPILEENAVKDIFANGVTFKDKKYSRKELEILLAQEIPS